jgi:hypothetical protein
MNTAHTVKSCTSANVLAIFVDFPELVHLPTMLARGAEEGSSLDVGQRPDYRHAVF